jgi:RNA polymerase sigma-70 factor (ECF subfamily)
MNTNKNTELVAVIYNGNEITVSREVADYLEECRLEERRQREKVRRHYSKKECAECAIEDSMFEKPQGFENALLDRLTAEKLPEAISTLSEVQRRRLMNYYYEGLTYQQIADLEHIRVSAIYNSITAAIYTLRNFFGALG